MKTFLKRITGIAILNFIFLLIAINFIPSKTPQTVRKISSIIPASTKSATLAVAQNPTPAVNIFSELKKHSSKSDCWIVYREHIYDITPVFGTHPGGDAIMLKYCGNDATVGFDTKDQIPANPHSANAVSLLQQYLVQ